MKTHFKVIANLNMQTTSGIIPGSTQKGVELSVSITTNDEVRNGWFELYDDETGGERWYASGGLWFEGNKVVDYDGVFELPKFIEDKLVEMGYDLSEL